MTPNWPPPVHRVLGVLAVLLVAACEQSQRAAAAPAADSAAGESPAAEMAHAGPRACDLLTAQDIAAVTKIEVSPGITTNDYMDVSQCRFDRVDGTQAVMVSLHRHGDIENYRKVPGAAAAEGVGDAAVWNAQIGQFAVRQGEAVTSISFLFSPADAGWGRSLAHIATAKLTAP